MSDDESSSSSSGGVVGNVNANDSMVTDPSNAAVLEKYQVACEICVNTVCDIVEDVEIGCEDRGCVCCR